jgi:hypothetical protein
MSGVTELVVSGWLIGCVQEQIGGHRTRSLCGPRPPLTPRFLERFPNWCPPNHVIRSGPSAPHEPIG